MAVFDDRKVGEVRMAVIGRPGSDLAPPLLETIQRGTLAYTYKGVPMLKNPFDLALYPMLLWETRPQSIIEIGSNRGGSALWLADLIRSFGLPAHIHSVDLNPVADIEDPAITFHRGDAEQLDRNLSPGFMRALPRPLLVIEDSSHFKETTLAVLNFFHNWLGAGEYIIIEDGIITEFGAAGAYRGGPSAAIEAFLAEHDEYEIDSRYCDWFGTNVTYAVNGFLRRRA
jgi:cephalosporin hydroxylase